MRKALLPPPSLEILIKGAKIIIEEFQVDNFVYLNSKGQWEENPKNLVDRISNEILYQLSKLEEKNQSLFIQNIFCPLSQGKNWVTTKKTKLAMLRISKQDLKSLEENEIDDLIIKSYSSANHSKKVYSFLIILEVLAWLLQYEVIRINRESFIPVWDALAKAQNQEYEKLLVTLNNSLKKFLTKKDRESFISDTLTKIRTASLDVIQLIPNMIAEEDRLMKKIRHLLNKGKNVRRRDEVYSLICENIQPPMGVVTYTSPALLRPCLHLLIDRTIDISSGIQYNASVILSILQDTRSIHTLLKAIHSFPLRFSKIRENLVYTLGNLKEKKATKAIAQILEAPDNITPSPEDAKIKIYPILEQKQEAIWAMGKIGLESLKYLSTLVKYVNHPSAELKTYLAWTLGEIGKEQKEKFGGVGADIVIALLTLLKINDKQIFEETVSALRKIDMPEFTHSLYFSNIGAISILGLKPAQKGLYELSETLHYLLNKKKGILIAINGDSGTGKTYFCQSIIDGFGDLKPGDILYLMRDRKRDQKVFNRILGIKWLKKYIEPIYYQDFLRDGEYDNPEEFLKQFLEEHSHKKLIILDGCRDKYYFQRIIDSLYFKGELDVLVNFRTSFSTRRLNLEDRELALESVKNHLSFIEEPSLEDTLIYQEGKVILYDLDNSLGSRLSTQETKELFEKRKIDSWGDLIIMGDFKKYAEPLKIETKKLAFRSENFSIKNEKLLQPLARAFNHEEKKFRAKLNENPENKPNLLQTIEMEEMKPEQIQLYAPEQIMGMGKEGSVFVLSFLDNRIFCTSMEKIKDISHQGRDIFLVNGKGELINISFERDEVLNFTKPDSPALVLAPFPGYKIITGHEDGTIRIWDFLNKNVQVLEGHQHPVKVLRVDYFGRIFSGSSDNVLRQWDVNRQTVKTIDILDNNISLVRLHNNGKLLVLTGENIPIIGGAGRSTHKIRILDFEKGISELINLPFKQRISNINSYFDGRIIAGLLNSKMRTEPGSGTLAVISLKKNSWEYSLLAGHEIDTKDCLAVGPKIITCGRDGKGEHTIRLWGTESYVKSALSKLSIVPSRL